MPLYSVTADFLSTSMLDMDGTLGANSDGKIASQKATKTYYQNSTAAKVYRSGILKTALKAYITTAVVSGGVATIYLTDDNMSTGSALFTNVYKESLNWWIDDAGNQYQVGSYTLAGDKKSITLTINKLGTVLVGIIQLISAANGVTVNVTIWGD